MCWLSINLAVLDVKYCQGLAGYEWGCTCSAAIDLIYGVYNLLKICYITR